MDDYWADVAVRVSTGVLLYFSASGQSCRACHRMCGRRRGRALPAAWPTFPATPWLAGGCCGHCFERCLTQRACSVCYHRCRRRLCPGCFHCHAGTVVFFCRSWSRTASRSSFSRTASASPCCGCCKVQSGRQPRCWRARSRGGSPLCRCPPPPPVRGWWLLVLCGHTRCVCLPYVWSRRCEACAGVVVVAI